MPQEDGQGDIARGKSSDGREKEGVIPRRRRVPCGRRGRSCASRCRYISPRQGSLVGRGYFAGGLRDQLKRVVAELEDGVRQDKAQQPGLFGAERDRLTVAGAVEKRHRAGIPGGATPLMMPTRSRRCGIL